ncbi:MAG: carbohydrate-binding domain-containing protein, partial [Clostridia bacterium]|nr:carbohydrate-binding domain-containing protein [Clostridia bacterium]
GDGLDGAVYSNDDLTVNGSGDLDVTSSMHGIVCKDDLKFTGGTVSITADKIGVQAGDSVSLSKAVLDIDSYHDGIQIENSDGDSYYYSEDSTVTVNADYDGINVGTSGDSFTGFVKIVSGSTNIVSGGGSDNSKSDTSQKGIKCRGDIIIGTNDNDELTLNVSGADDAVNSKGTVYVNGGTLTLSSSDDGISAYSAIEINDGDVDITKSYEGLEAGEVTLNGGSVKINSSDDGVNTAGGTDADELVKTENGTLTINDGYIYVNASGDGLDSNGSVYVNGGTVIIEGPSDNGNAALDKGDDDSFVLSINGGTVLALGSSAKAKNFDSGEQCSALITVSGSDGTKITMSDGFEFTASKKFDCIVYSSPNLEQGKTYTATVGETSVEFSFDNGKYFEN